MSHVLLISLDQNDQNLFCEYYILRALGYFNSENYTRNHQDAEISVI